MHSKYVLLDILCRESDKDSVFYSCMTQNQHWSLMLARVVDQTFSYSTRFWGDDFSMLFLILF